MSRFLCAGRWLPALALAITAGCDADARRGDPSAADRSASRIVTLSPHLAELVDRVGAREMLAGVSAHTSLDDGAPMPPEIGDAFVVDLESLALIDPDLILAWASGTTGRTVEELRARGYRVEVVVTKRLADVAVALERIGELTGRADAAAEAGRQFTDALARLRQEYADKPVIRVFYQISALPLYTINGSHFVSELIALCGGRNIFADLDELAPLVSEEAVLSRDPEVILAGVPDPQDAPGEIFSAWQRWPTMAANRHGNRFVIDAALISRPTPTLIEAGRKICNALDKARARRASTND